MSERAIRDSSPRSRSSFSQKIGVALYSGIQDDADADAGARLEVGAQGIGAAAAPGQLTPEEQHRSRLLPLRGRRVRVRARRGVLDGRNGNGTGRQSVSHVRQLPGRPLRHHVSAVVTDRRLGDFAWIAGDIALVEELL